MGLCNEVVAALQDGGIAPEYIEFLGWLPGNASALNNSKNPVKAAHTLLAREGNIKMLAKFFAKKLQQLVPDEVADHPEADRLLREHRRATRGFRPHYTQEEVDEHAPED